MKIFICTDRYLCTHILSGGIDRHTQIGRKNDTIKQKCLCTVQV